MKLCASASYSPPPLSLIDLVWRQAYLHQLIREMADQGTSIFLISSDMPEIIKVVDRIIVI